MLVPKSLKIHDTDVEAYEALAVASGESFNQMACLLMRAGYQALTQADAIATDGIRRRLDTVVARQQFQLAAQSTLLLQELAEHAGIAPDVIDAIKAQAAEVADEAFSEVEALELAVDDVQRALAGEPLAADQA